MSTIAPSRPSGADVSRVLADVFGFSALRPGQREVIDDLLDGHPVVTVMPTGAGKSLCYQLPAVLLGEQGGVALVVSPLIALMKDQVDSLRARGVAAAALTSASSPDVQRNILEGIGGGEYRVVYVAPERFRSARFLEALSSVGNSLSLLAIDEAHCISEWGHEFRPDYRRLGEVAMRLAPPRLIALTATATPQVRDDIATQLHMDTARFHVHGFDRPNLRYSVQRVGGAADKGSRLVELVRTRSGGTALVYTATRKNAEKHAAVLGTAGMRVRVYHAGLADDDRRQAQDEFMDGKLDAIVATNAFGMGVDKADIRVVVHADLPRSPEAYYQEAGRGGRDGEPGECVLLFNHGDVRLQEFLINASYPTGELLRAMWKLLHDHPELGGSLDTLGDRLPGSPHASVVSSAARILGRHGLLVDTGTGVEATRPGQLAGEFEPLDVASIERRSEVERSKLRKMVEYAYQTRCRRQFVLDYFGDEEWSDAMRSCDNCDNCQGDSGAVSLSEEQQEHVRLLLQVVQAIPNRFGRARLAAVANGTDDDARLAELPERACLRGQASNYLKDLFRALEGVGLVEPSRGEYPVLSITRKGRRVARGEETVDGLMLMLPKSGRKRASRKAKVAAASEPLDSAALERAEVLRELRTGLARAASVPAYVVFSNKTLEDLARRNPKNEDELLGVTGIGAARVERYGEAILSAFSSTSRSAVD